MKYPEVAAILRPAIRAWCDKGAEQPGTLDDLACAMKAVIPSSSFRVASISEHQSGKTAPSYAACLAYVQVLDVSLDELVVACTQTVEASDG